MLPWFWLLSACQLHMRCYAEPANPQRHAWSAASIAHREPPSGAHTQLTCAATASTASHAALRLIINSWLQAAHTASDNCHILCLAACSSILHTMLIMTRHASYRPCSAYQLHPQLRSTFYDQKESSLESWAGTQPPCRPPLL
ncbi:hypothetical protein V8C86DRAFT_2889758 [Haematococcus lacustris]